MSAKLDSIIAALDEQETSLGEVLALVSNLRAQIKDGATTADLDRVLAEVQQNKGKIDAVLAEDVPPTPTPEA